MLGARYGLLEELVKRHVQVPSGLSGHAVVGGHAVEGDGVGDPVGFVPRAIGVEDEDALALGVVGANGGDVAIVADAHVGSSVEVEEQVVARGGFVLPQEAAQAFERVRGCLGDVGRFEARGGDAEGCEALARQLRELIEGDAVALGGEAALPDVAPHALE